MTVEPCEACTESFNAALSAVLGVQGVPGGPSKRVIQKSNPAAAAAASTDERSSIAFVPFDQNGEPVDPCKVALLSRGFHPKAKVTDQEGVTKTIEKIKSDGSVVLLTGTKQEEVAFNVFLDGYELNFDVSEEWVDLQASQLDKCTVHKGLMQKHAVMLAIQGAFESHPLTAGSLTIRTNLHSQCRPTARSRPGS